ncbi:hypothetical protein CHELA40_50340 [Chelatococcus asaccharovorans]|nr:hypothetical protein CHELA17_20305 [Chelatococcus asaccharovorans]CAH1692393.1 hypothetical protein CHELA40_50340 [Chelatococcus asaccharovorans]
MMRATPINSAYVFARRNFRDHRFYLAELRKTSESFSVDSLGAGMDLWGNCVERPIPWRAP